jgi:hypothetical protein
MILAIMLATLEDMQEKIETLSRNKTKFFLKKMMKN